MIPDLGKYAGAVLGSYAAAMVLLSAIVGLTLWQARQAKRALRDVERRAGRNNG
ncbi:MAG: heme exporter protein CcmD [Pseudomonadota bacterium]